MVRALPIAGSIDADLIRLPARGATQTRAQKKNYAEALSRLLATRLANGLRPYFDGIIPDAAGRSQESKARTSKGYKKLDVNYSTAELRLGLGVSVKTLNFVDETSQRYTKNYVQGGPQAANLARLPALRWPDAMLQRHTHHHHRFDAAPAVPGAEMETSRGCPYHRTFCAKDNFRDRCRWRPLPTILEELDGLIAVGVGYVYFIDEIFLPWRELPEAVAQRPVAFGVQTRIDLWREDMLDLLGAAGCVSIEAGVERLTPAGRDWLDKDCRISRPTN
jgi:hypothetical protein